MKQPSFEALRKQNAKAPGVCFSFDAPPADGGLQIGIFSRKFHESSAKERAKVKAHFEGSGPVTLAKKSPDQQQPGLRRGFRDASCMFARL